MPEADLLTFTLLATLLTLTPGADTLVLLRNVLRSGTRAGMATALGGRFGLAVHATLSALGLSAVLAHSASAYAALKLVGACYLVWIGIQSLIAATRSGDRGADPVTSVAPNRSTREGSLLERLRLRGPFGEGLLTNVLNPKTALFYLAFLPQFVRPDDHVFVRSLLLCSVHVGISLVWFLGLSVGLGRARRFLSTRSPVHRLLEGVSGAFLTALGIRLAIFEH